MEAGADPSIVDASDLSALHYAAYNGLTFLVEVLVDRYPFLLNRRDMNGNTPLHFAAFKNEIEVSFSLFLWLTKYRKYLTTREIFFA